MCSWGACVGQGLWWCCDPPAEPDPAWPRLSCSPALHRGHGVPGGRLRLDDPALLPQAVPAQHGGHRPAPLVRLGRDRGVSGVLLLLPLSCSHLWFWGVKVSGGNTLISLCFAADAALALPLRGFSSLVTCGGGVWWAWRGEQWTLSAQTLVRFLALSHVRSPQTNLCWMRFGNRQNSQAWGVLIIEQTLVGARRGLSQGSALSCLTSSLVVWVMGLGVTPAPQMTPDWEG